MVSSEASVRGRGRPRSGVAARPELSPHEQILDAAARLFVHQGYSTTSTREIAEAVGIRQASLYYHFDSKDDILDAVLRATVQPSLDLLDRLAVVPLSPAARLWALAAADSNLLATRPHNPAALYVLPELRRERFAEMRALRKKLRAEYLRLANETMLAAGIREAGIRGDLVFAVVESVSALRQDAPAIEPATMAPTIADAVLRVLGLDPAMRDGAANEGSIALYGDSYYSPAETMVTRMSAGPV